MLLEILVGVIVSLAYLVGAFLYFVTKEEFEKCASKLAVFRKLKYLSILYGVILALSFRFNYAEIVSLILFAWVMVQSSLAVVNVKKKLALKNSVMQGAVLFIVFLISFLAQSL